MNNYSSSQDSIIDGKMSWVFVENKMYLLPLK